MRKIILFAFICLTLCLSGCSLSVSSDSSEEYASRQESSSKETYQESSVLDESIYDENSGFKEGSDSLTESSLEEDSTETSSMEDTNSAYVSVPTVSDFPTSIPTPSDRDQEMLDTTVRSILYADAATWKSGYAQLSFSGNRTGNIMTYTFDHDSASYRYAISEFSIDEENIYFKIYVAIAVTAAVMTDEDLIQSASAIYGRLIPQSGGDDGYILQFNGIFFDPQVWILSSTPSIGESGKPGEIVSTAPEDYGHKVLRLDLCEEELEFRKTDLIGTWVGLFVSTSTPSSPPTLVLSSDRYTLYYEDKTLTGKWDLTYDVYKDSFYLYIIFMPDEDSSDEALFREESIREIEIMEPDTYPNPGTPLETTNLITIDLSILKSSADRTYFLDVTFQRA